jgi:hypothetical protein
VLTKLSDGSVAAPALSIGLPAETGGDVACFTLDANAPQLREAPTDVLEPLSKDQCRDATKAAAASDACSDCLCACDATAAGHCGQCTSLASCTVLFCGLANSVAERRDCMALFCNAKLLPSFVFDRAVDLAPCMTECALTCGY